MPPASEVNADEAIVAPAAYKIIYVYSDDNENHKGRVKVGDTIIHTAKHFTEITQDEINAAAHKRIDTYTKTADVVYTLEHAELAIRPVFTQRLDETPTQWASFRDHKVHKVLKLSNHEKTFARKDKTNGEWFEISIETAKAAITAVKNYDYFLDETSIGEITLRPEQKEAIKKTKPIFKHATFDDPKRMLWNAKMRFGKTLTAYSLVREFAEESSWKKVLILTHRPDVNDSWWTDFKKIGLADEGWSYGSKRNDRTWEDTSRDDKFFWFASIQDLRGSYSSDNLTDADFKELAKNEALFSTEWDLILTDEAHEGTLTELAKRMFAGIKSKCFLDLSGTPFNIIKAENWEDEELSERFSYHGQYHWSYPDERKAKREWTETHGEDEYNPYSELPEVRFITYDVSDSIAALRETSDEGKTGDISFTELFRTKLTDTGRNFVHEEQVEDFLHKMQGLGRYSDDPSLFPYHKAFQNYFNHTLWMLPNVPACEAMERLLNQHSSGFSGFKVVNATGIGGETWEGNKTALPAVHNAISNNANTIVLSQQMLTTGVTVTPWTAVFMLNNTKSAMLYMQTAFRAASPGSLPDGRSKDISYVFDFNPSRCLTEIVELAKTNAPMAPNDDPIEQEKLDRNSVNEYLEYISALSLTGSKFIAPDSNAIMEKLNEAYISEVIENGFDSPRLWNNKKLLSFDIQKVKILEALRKLQGGKDGDKKTGVVPISELTSDEQAYLDELNKKADAEPPEPLTNEETTDKNKLNDQVESNKKQERKNRDNAVSILAGVAARMPMLVYASPAEERITPENFADLIDDESWLEFMPKNLLRVMPAGMKSLEERQDEALGDEGNLLYWEDIRQFFDPVIFSLSCERLRQTTRELGEKEPVERAFRTAALFSNFKRPDKETILTPWRVVNLQYGSTLGGLQFIDLEKSTATHVLAYTRNIETDELESHSVKLTLSLLDNGTHKLAPVWKTSEVDAVENSGDGFWEEWDTTTFDINSKTALYPLYAAVSFYYAIRQHREREYQGKRTVNFYSDVTESEIEAKDRLLWKDIVEQKIFVNCRVPYSRKIAERVLRGFDDGVSVNASVVDVIEVRNKLKELGFYNNKTEPKQHKTETEEEYNVRLTEWRKTTPSEKVDDVWRWVLSPESLRNGSGSDDKICLAEERVAQIMKAESGEEVLELLNELSEEQENFTSVVGNPPYQEQSTASDENNAATNVFQHFYEISSFLARYLSLVFPGGRWMQRSAGSGTIADTIFSNLHTVTWYRNGDDGPRELFPEARIRDGVAIVFSDTQFVESSVVWNGFSIPRPTKEDIYPLQKELTSIALKGVLFSPKRANSKYVTRTFFGIYSQFTEKNPGKYTPITTLPSMFNDPIKAWLANETPGSGKSVKEYWIDRSSIDWTPHREEMFHNWKVIAGQGGIGKDPQFENYRVIDNEHIVGESYVIVGNFPTKSEALNYSNYLNTLTVKRLLEASKGGKLRKWGWFVPDLEDYTDSNQDIDWTRPLDPQLYKLFGLTEEEISIIEGEK